MSTTITGELADIHQAKLTIADKLISDFGVPKANLYTSDAADATVKRLAQWDLSSAEIILANPLCFDKSGEGDDISPATCFDGSVGTTISYNSIGAVSLDSEQTITGIKHFDTTTYIDDLIGGNVTVARDVKVNDCTLRSSNGCLMFIFD